MKNNAIVDLSIVELEDRLEMSAVAESASIRIETLVIVL